MPVHGPGLGVLVLGVEGHEHLQTGADGLGHIADRVEIADGTGEQLVGGEVLHAQKGGEVGLRLSGGELVHGLLGGGEEDLGVLSGHPLGQGGGGMFAKPGSRLKKAGQVAGQLGPIAAAGQGEKLVEVAGYLGWPQLTTLGGSGEMGEDHLVVVASQDPGQALVLWGGLPGVGEEVCRRLDPSLGGLKFGAPGQRPLGFGQKGLGGLGGPDRFPGPVGHGAAVEAAVLGLGQQLGDQLVGPSPAFQQPGGPQFARIFFGHGLAPFPRFCHCIIFFPPGQRRSPGGRWARLDILPWMGA